MPQTSTAVAGVLIVLTSMLLVGLRFSATWAGEDGYKPNATAHLLAQMDAGSQQAVENSGEVIRRGQAMSTKQGEWKKYIINMSTDSVIIYLDENTEVKLVSANGLSPSLQLTQGRILLKGQGTVLVRDTHVRSNGLTSFTFYSWLDRLDVSQINGTLDLIISDISMPAPSASFTLDTLPPHDPPSSIEFNPDESAAANFYKWASTDSETE